MAIHQKKRGFLNTKTLYSNYTAFKMQLYIWHTFNRLGVTVSQFLLHILQFLLSSVQVQCLTFLPNVFVVVTVHRRVGTLSDETGLVESKVCSTSVSPFQRNLIFLQILLRNCRLVYILNFFLGFL
jgi:hypothetical protein